MSYTLIIVIVTSLVSFAAFNNRDLRNKLIFYPFGMHDRPNEYYRFLTSGFIHADWNHLLFNMITLYFFGSVVETICAEIGMPSMYLLLYLSGIIFASLPTYVKQKNQSYYTSLGASGGVAAILFATVYFEPWNKIYIIFLPIGIPSIIFAVLYLFYSAYMSKKGNDNIGHDAHFWGSVYGFVFAYLLDLKFSHGMTFINQLLHPHF